MLPTSRASKAGQKWSYLCNYLYICAIIFIFVQLSCFIPDLRSVKYQKWSIFSNFHNGIIKKLGHFLQLNIMHLKDIITGFQKNGMVCRVPNYSLGDIAYGNLKITANSAKILDWTKCVYNFQKQAPRDALENRCSEICSQNT